MHILDGGGDGLRGGLIGEGDRVLVEFALSDLDSLCADEG